MPVLGMKATRESIRYGFAVGKVRVLETKVFGHATYERLLDAATFAEQLRILSDTIYGRYLDGAETSRDVERGLDRALDDFYGFLDEANLPKPVVGFFRERYDFANLKGALKAQLLESHPDDMFAGLGTLPLAVFEGPLEDLPEPFGPIAESVLEKMHAGDRTRGRVGGEIATRVAGGAGGAGEEAPEGALQAVDAEVDRAMFTRLSKLARDSKSSFLKDLAALQIDIANVKTLLRARLAQMSPKKALSMTLAGGSIKADELATIYELPLIEAGERLGRLPVLSGIPPTELADVAHLDVVADNVVVQYLRRARMVPVGAEPVIAYVMGREAEVRAVRTLLLGRLAGLPTEVLRSRLRDLYV